MSDVGVKVEEITSKVLEVDPAMVKGISNFNHDLGADSLDVVELIMCLEEEFNIEISDIEASNIFTVNEAVAFIEKKMET
tara:strand:+ start:341 stop:580 length:240 start_codon:yes stop_codon:yes gene_type:complete